MLINLLDSYSFLALCAFIVDYIFGSIKLKYHPIVLIGKFINLFERLFYKDSIQRGIFVFLATNVVALSFVGLFFVILPKTYWYVFEVVLCSLLIANKMLYTEVKKVVLSNSPKEKLRYLVSRDVDNLSDSDVYKACIETYAENINDAVVAPLFYLLTFGIWGLVIYKCTNTLDSMIGYRNARYEKYGKVSAKADDVLNFIPARLTALIVLFLNNKLKYLKNINKVSRYYTSPNAVYPIGAFAYCLEICLGGPTSYFGKIIYKPILGYNKCKLDKSDVFRALKQKNKLDSAIVLILIILTILQNWRIFVK